VRGPGERARKAHPLASAASLGWLSPATRRRLFLRWSQQPERWPDEATTLSEYCRAEMFEKDMWPPSRSQSGSTVDLTLYHLATGNLLPWAVTMT